VLSGLDQSKEIFGEAGTRLGGLLYSVDSIYSKSGLDRSSCDITISFVFFSAMLMDSNVRVWSCGGSVRPGDLRNATYHLELMASFIRCPFFVNTTESTCQRIKVE
jgi:hypothetical protein